MSIMSPFIKWQGISKNEIPNIKPYLKQEQVEEEEEDSTTDHEEEDQQVPSTSDEKEVTDSEEDGEEGAFASEKDDQEEEEEEPTKSLPSPPVFGKLEGERRNYSAEDRAAYVHQVIDKSRPISEVAKKFGIPYSTLYGWVKKEKSLSGVGQKEGRKAPIAQDEGQDQSVPGDIGNKKQPNPPSTSIPPQPSKENEEKRTRRRYTSEEKQQCLYELIKKERKVSEVAGEYGIPRSTLYNWSKKAKEGIDTSGEEKRTRRTYSSGEKASYVYEILGKGKKTSDVCKEFNLPRSTVDNWLRLAKASKEQDSQTQIEEGVKSRRSCSADERSKCISEVIVKKKTMADAAREYNIPYSTLRGWVQKAKEGREGYELVSHNANEKQVDSAPAVTSKRVSATRQAKEGYEASHHLLEKEAATVQNVVTSKQVPAATAPSAPQIQQVDSGKKTRRTYTAEEKARCVSEILGNKKTVSAVAREFEIPRSTLDSWVKKAKAVN